MTEQLASAVNGWRQAISILRSLEEGLTFTISEIENRRHAIQDFGRVQQFAKAKADLTFARRYLSAMPPLD